MTKIGSKQNRRQNYKTKISRPIRSRHVARSRANTSFGPRRPVAITSDRDRVRRRGAIARRPIDFASRADSNRPKLSDG
jgi:hypothetical protein